MIPPLLSIEHQMESICEEWKIPYCNISTIEPKEIMPSLKTNDVKILLASIECISDVTVQKAIQDLKVNYIAVDECQVTSFMCCQGGGAISGLMMNPKNVFFLNCPPPQTCVPKKFRWC